MTLKNNHTFVSPRNQRITHLDSRPHMKYGQPTKDSYGLDYPTMSSLINAVISQKDNKFPCRQFMSGCSFDNIVWQQAIGALMNQDHSRCTHSLADEEKVLFDLVSAGLINHQEFDEPHKWLLRSIRYSAVVADHLWSLYEAEHKRNDRVEVELHALKGQVNLLSSCLLAVDHFSFDANKKVNTELEKDGDKHNALVQFVGNHSSQLELHHRGLLSLHDRMCTCNMSSKSPVDGSGEAPSFSSPSTPRCENSPSPPVIAVEPEEAPIVAPVENEVPIPVVPPSPAPCRTVVESSMTLQVIHEDEAREIEDRIVGAWQRQGADNVTPTTLIGSESSKNFGPSCVEPAMASTPEWLPTQSLEARGYQMLSVMRAVTLMLNATVSARLLSSDHVGRELQLIFLVSQEEFDSLLSGELEAEGTSRTLQHQPDFSDSHQWIQFHSSDRHMVLYFDPITKQVWGEDSVSKSDSHMEDFGDDKISAAARLVDILDSFEAPRGPAIPSQLQTQAPDHSDPSGSCRPHDVVRSDTDSEPHFLAAEKGKQLANLHVPMSEDEPSSDEGGVSRGSTTPMLHTATRDHPCQDCAVFGE
ncbi:hypothetical protein BDM02DRAFT_3192647 [Thelephora ganbajun]|uniref:Uncharacterized protein n=1 Tax=Thelephora ganbajun TaxID=370292 RepID=A0ACB6YZT7_THEGA|nr:hypothetical protein BDM02DRAFT_3192647 [Thelephora ganbajun]